MSRITNIEWASSTGNPWIGCTKVSPGCKNCYAAELDENRFSKTMGGGTKEKPVSHWGKGAPRFKTKGFWKDAVKWNQDARDWPFKCPSCGETFCSGNSRDECQEPFIRHRPRIFPSLCDWLDEEVPLDWRLDFMQLIVDTPNLDWLLLTKRPQEFGRLFGNLEECVRLLDHGHATEKGQPLFQWCRRWLEGMPPENVWLGVSVEDQARAEEPIPLLLRIPAKVRFLSVEPLLERVCLRFGYNEDEEKFEPFPVFGEPTNQLHWVIVGGESGANRRDCGVEAIGDVARQCQAAGVPCFVKQDCAARPGQQGRIPADIWALKQFPK